MIRPSPSQSPGPYGKIRFSDALAVFLIVTLGAVLRALGTGDALWLDELISLDLARAMQAWHDAFWKLAVDNNHPLNTLWLYLIGPDVIAPGQAPWLYRALSVIAGTAFVAATGLLALYAPPTERGPSAPILRLGTALAVAAIAYPFVHFGSEARGYALMSVALLGAFWAVERQNRWGFAGFATLAVLSHPGAVLVLALLVAGLGASRLNRGDAPRRALGDMVHLAAPFAGLLLAWVVVIAVAQDFDINNLRLGGMPTPCPEAGCFAAALGGLARFMAGAIGPEAPWTYAVGYGALALLGVLRLWWVGHARWAVYAMVLLGGPALFWALNQPAWPAERYFLGVFALIPLMAGDVAGTFAGPRARHAVLAVLALWVALNATALARFYDHGRGDVLTIANAFVDATPGGDLRVGADMAFQARTLLSHAIDGRRALTVVPPDGVGDAHPRWIMTTTRPVDDASDRLCVNGVAYDLLSTSAYWGLSGVPIAAYRRAGHC